MQRLHVSVPLILYTDLSTSISMHAMKCYLKTPVDEHQCGSVANCYIVLQDEVPSIVDCPDPDHMIPHERRVARIAHEEASFDAEYYLYKKYTARGSASSWGCRSST